MASLLTASQQSEIAAKMGDLFDTVSRDIKIIRRGKRVMIASDPNFNFAYPENTTFTDEIVEEFTVRAKIRYDKDQIIALSTPESADGESRISNEIKIRMENGGARINVKSDGLAAIRGAEVVVLDGEEFVIDGSIRPRLNFGAQIYNIKLKRKSKNG